MKGKLCAAQTKRICLPWSFDTARRLFAFYSLFSSSSFSSFKKTSGENVKVPKRGDGTVESCAFRLIRQGTRSRDRRQRT